MTVSMLPIMPCDQFAYGSTCFTFLNDFHYHKQGQLSACIHIDQHRAVSIIDIRVQVNVQHKLEESIE